MGVADHPDGWNEERVTRLKGLWLLGYTGTQIARDLGGLTRSAVCGKVHRLGLKRTDVSEVRRVSSSRRAASNQARAALQKMKIAKAKAAKPPTFPVVEVIPMPATSEGPLEPLVADLMALEPSHCRWPCGPFLAPAEGFCGRKKAEGSSYCPTHRALSIDHEKIKRAGGEKQLVKSVRRHFNRETVANEYAA